jgi:hypothetical protein
MKSKIRYVSGDWPVAAYGVSRSANVITSVFHIATGPPFEQALDQPGLKKNVNYPALAEYVVVID